MSEEVSQTNTHTSPLNSYQSHLVMHVRARFITVLSGNPDRKVIIQTTHIHTSRFKVHSSQWTILSNHLPTGHFSEKSHFKTRADFTFWDFLIAGFKFGFAISHLLTILTHFQTFNNQMVFPTSSDLISPSTRILIPVSTEIFISAWGWVRSGDETKGYHTEGTKRRIFMKKKRVFRTS